MNTTIELIVDPDGRIRINVVTPSWIIGATVAAMAELTYAQYKVNVTPGQSLKGVEQVGALRLPDGSTEFYFAERDVVLRGDDADSDEEL